MFFQAFSRYDHYLLLVKKESVTVWEDQFWRGILFPAVDSLAGPSPSTPAVYARLVEKPSGRTVRVGPVHWTDEAPSSWANEGHEFVDAQVLFPRPSGGDRFFPSVYLHVQRMVSDAESVTSYDQFIHLAIRKKFDQKNRSRIDRVMKGLTGLSEVVGAYRAKSMVWSIDELESTIALSFLYRGILRDHLPDLTKTPQRWGKLDYVNSKAGVTPQNST